MDLVEKEERELSIVEQFLPEQLTKEEIDKIVKDIIQITGASNMADMGMVMKKVMDTTKGSADGKIISELVRGYLK